MSNSTPLAKWTKIQKLIAPELELSGNKLFVMSLNEYSNNIQKSNYRVLLSKYNLEEYALGDKKILIVDESHSEIESLNEDFNSIMQLEILDADDYKKILKE